MTVPPERCRRAFEVDLVAFVHDASGPTWADFREHYPLCADCSVEVRTWTELEIVLQGGAPPATTHPTPDDLLRFDDGDGLDADYRRIVDYHVASCRPCADEIATLRAFDFSALDARATPPAFVGHTQVPTDRSETEPPLGVRRADVVPHATPLDEGIAEPDAEVADELPTRDDAPAVPIAYAAEPEAEPEAPVLEAAPAPVPETDVEPLAEPALDASAGSAPVPSADLDPLAELPPEAESTTPELHSGAAASEPEPVLEVEPASEPESVLEARAASEPEPVLDPEPTRTLDVETIDHTVQLDGDSSVEPGADAIAGAPSEATPAPALDTDARAVPDPDAEPTVVPMPEPAVDGAPAAQVADAVRVPSDGGFLPPEALLEGFEGADDETRVGLYVGAPGRFARIARHPAVGVLLVAVLLLPVLWVGELPRFPFGAPARPVVGEPHQLPEARVAVATVLEPAAGLTAEERALEMPSKLSEPEVEPAAEASEPKEPTQVALARGDDTLSDAPGVIVPEEAEVPADASDPWALARLDDAGPLEIVGESLAAGIELEVPVPLTVPAGAVLQVQISGADAREIVERLSFPGAREVAVRVPAGWLVPGTYEVRVGVVRRGPAPVRVASYALVVH